MQIVAARFGQPVMVLAVDADGVIARVLDRFVRLTGPDAPAEPAARRDPESPALAPFTLTDLGAQWRLAWPRGGCSIKRRARLTAWATRYAAIVEASSLTVVDSESSRRTRFEWRGTELGLDGAGVVTFRDHLVIGGDNAVVWIALADLLASHARELDLVVTSSYPVRRPDARVPARCAWVTTGDEALINVERKQIRISCSGLGLVNGQDLALCDELYPERYGALELPDGSRHALELDPPVALRARAVRAASRDPGATAPVIAPRDERLERLLRDVAANPDDDAPRLVLVDLLQELDETYGRWLATEQTRTGARPNRHDALGPLTHFLDNVEYRCGLPWSATLARRVPRDPEVLALATADLRLGMLSALRIGSGPVTVYAQLVGAATAIGLRHVDVNEREVIEALVAANRDHITHLHDMRFTTKRNVALLADPTFDRATEVEAFTQPMHVEGLLRRVADDAAGFFARVPRHLWIRDRFDHDRDLVPPALARWADLPLRQLTVGAVSLRRTDAGTLATLRDDDVIVRQRLRDLPDLVAIERPKPDDVPAITRARGQAERGSW